MFLGHALLAFALATLVADWRGWPARRALSLGVVAGAFAAIPDIDVAYAAVAIDFGALSAESVARPSTFWDATRGVHRAMTHSLVVSLLAGPAFGLWTLSKPHSPRVRAVGRTGSAVALAGLVGVAFLVSGPLGGIVMGLFVVAGVSVAAASRFATDFSARTIGLAATAGLLSHPWGDLVTGEPPQLFYPLSVRVFDGRVMLHDDATAHLLGAFALELAVVWLAAVAVARVTDRSLPRLVDRRASAGLAYGVAAVVMTPPTLEVSYHFVFSILAVGLVCAGFSAVSDLSWGATTLRHRARSVALERRWSGPTADGHIPSLGVALTALTGITAALGGYATVYAAAIVVAA
nr:metal-dependent hydrolase [Halostagnicola kamekurae]